MKIIEDTSQRLVIRFQRGLMAVAIAGFTILSVLVVINLVIQGTSMLLLRYEGWRVLTLFVWTLVGLVMIALGVVSWSNVGRGITCTFDKVKETVTIRQPHWFRMEEVTHSIYSVSHVDLLENSETRSFGIFMVLRSGERIALATVPIFEEAEVRGLVNHVRSFLRA